MIAPALIVRCLDVALRHLKNLKKYASLKKALSARLREGGKTDFDRERGEEAGGCWADWAGLAARREKELGRNRPNDLGKDLKTFSN